MADGIYYNPEPQLLVESVVLDNNTLSGGGFDSFSVTATKSGYTPIGVVGWRVDNASSSGGQGSYCFLYRCYLASNAVQFFCRNTSSNQAKVKFTAYVLYRKN